MTPSHSLWPLGEMQLAEDTLDVEVQLLSSSFITEIKLLEGALVASRQASPFTLEHVRLPDDAKLAANCWRIIAHSQNLVQGFIRRQLAGESPFRATAPLRLVRLFMAIHRQSGSTAIGPRPSYRPPQTATSHPGSWWLHWLDWIQPYAGPQVSARVPGDGGLQPLEAAPGSYVKVAGIE